MKKVDEKFGSFKKMTYLCKRKSEMIKSGFSSVGQNAAFGYSQQKTEKNETVYRIYLDNSNPHKD